MSKSIDFSEFESYIPISTPTIQTIAYNDNLLDFSEFEDLEEDEDLLSTPPDKIDFVEFDTKLTSEDEDFIPLSFDEFDEPSSHNLFNSTPKFSDSVSDKKKSSTSSIKKKSLSICQLRDLLLECFDFMVFENNLFLYDVNYGYYLNVSDEMKFDIKLREIIPVAYEHMINTNTTKELRKSLLSRKLLYVSEKDVGLQDSYINFKNGVLDIISGKLLPHNPKYYFQNYINANYLLRNVRSAPYFSNFLYTVSEGDMAIQNLLQEVTGYALSDKRTIKKAIFLIGPSHSGKSTYLNLLENLIGKSFCSNISLHQMNEKYKIASLLGKKLNTCGEISEKGLSRLDIFKSLTGQDPINAEFKFGQPFDFINKALLVFAGNSLPKSNVSDSHNAFLKRLLIIPFRNSIPTDEMQHDILTKMLDESDYIVSWAYEGLQRLINNNFKFSECDTSDITTSYDSLVTNNIQEFLENECLLTENTQDKLFGEELYGAYSLWCLKNALSAMPHRSFISYIKGNTTAKYSKFQKNNENRRGFIGIRLIS